MWSPLSWKNNFVTIVLGQDQLALSWIQPKHTLSHKQLGQCELKAYRVVPLVNMEVQSHVVNLTRLKKEITDFLAHHKLKHAHVALALWTPSVLEQIAVSSHATPTKSDFPFITSPHVIWDWAYLYPGEQSNFNFYVCGIKQEDMLQYKLLAIACNMQLKLIMPARLALLHLYRHVQGPAFRHSQLAVSMHNNNNVIEQLCSGQTMHRLLTINPHLSINYTQQAEHINVALGLVISHFISEGSL